MNSSKNGNYKTIIQRRRFLITVVGVYLLVVGFLSGMLTERIRFDEYRSGILATLEEETHRVHARLMEMERAETY